MTRSDLPRYRSRTLALLIACALSGGSAGASAYPLRDDPAWQAGHIDAVDPERARALERHPGVASPQPLERVYRAAGDQPVWLTEGRPRPAVDRLMDALSGTPAHGIPAQPTRVAELEGRLAAARAGRLDTAAAADLDLALTRAYLDYAGEMLVGGFAAAHGERGWQLEPARSTGAEALIQAIEGGAPAAALDTLVPDHDQYRRLQAALSLYRVLAERGGWAPIPDTGLLREGDAGPAVTAVIRRLLLTGDYILPLGEPGPPLYYDRGVADAVRRFQARHGLLVDGLVGPRTRDAMNVPAQERVRQIALQLARWRWLPPELGQRYLLVNIPEYRLRVYEGGEPVLGMRVIVGSRGRPTPVFRDQLEYVVFGPYWNVPHSIAVEEILPRARQEPRYLLWRNMEVLLDGVSLNPTAIAWSEVPAHGFPFRIRQRPGPGNALGRVKFMFPNRHAVYLHDTPEEHLFGATARAFSHGCVRVAQPATLAAYLLGDRPEWSGPAVEQAMDRARAEHVPLSAPLPVYLGYFTVWADGEGRVRFFPDLYGHDRRALAL